MHIPPNRLDEESEETDSLFPRVTLLDLKMTNSTIKI